MLYTLLIYIYIYMYVYVYVCIYPDMKRGISPSKKKCFICFDENPFKNDEKCFLFHLKSSFRSQDI